MDAPKQRTSLSKKQLQTNTGLELLNICQSITGDGQIADEEIQALNNWMMQNQDSELPAIKFMTATLSQVLADGVITDAERLSVAEAIETILPISDRKYAKGLRKQVEQEAVNESKAASALAKQHAKEKKERERPIAFMDFMVAGTRHDDRDLTISHEISSASPVFLRRDPGNRHSRFAIRVLTERGNMIGFVPDDDARHIAPLLDAGATHVAQVKKVLDYDSGPVPVVVARIFEAGTQPSTVSKVRDVSERKPPSKKRWPIILAIMIILFVVLAKTK